MRRLGRLVGIGALGWAWAGTAAPPVDWLIDPSPYRARVEATADGRGLVLGNGLVRREFRIAPNVATVAIDHGPRDEALLRGVKPEAIVVLDGVRHEVGGLRGQPNLAFLRPEWIESMKADPSAFRYVGHTSGPVTARMEWKRVRHHAPGVEWPPRGVHLRFDYAMPPAAAVDEAGAPSAEGRERLFSDDFRNLDPAWRVRVVPGLERSSFRNEGKPGEIHTPANTAVLAEHPLPPGVELVEVVVDVGTDRSASWGPGMALVGAGGSVKFHLRPGGSAESREAEFGLAWAGREILVPGARAGLDPTRPARLRLRQVADGWRAEYAAPEGPWRPVGTVPADALPGGAERLRVGKLDRSGGGGDFGTPGEWVRCRILSVAAYGARAVSVPDPDDRSRDIRVSVHYELYDGIPAWSKWLTVSNGTPGTVRVDSFTSEILAAVERTSEVDDLSEGAIVPDIHVETDMAFGGMMARGANSRAVHWVPDPDFHTQVNYRKETPCLLEVRPDLGPAVDLAPGAVFESFRAWVLPFDGTDRERNGLAVRRLYRTVAPWVTENPLMMHARFADWASVTNAVLQCEDVGFEMVILTFGSGFNLEDESAGNREHARRLAAFAREHGIEIGTYSLLASRRVGGGSDVVLPDGERPRFGESPCLGSDWGTNYFRQLDAFYRDSGFTLLEHDGSYPGDRCLAEDHPGHRGEADSRWTQWRTLSDFYRWCRGEGIYLNVPDHYFLGGSSKTGMGYREVNWSLPRAQQVIHTRQNIYDGTWQKTPSMGWMFVPLTEYHGGGAAATIEPLDAHLDHYERMLSSNLALGVQACYRGPRLYDTPRVRDRVRHWVDWFKAHRDILESDLIHGRRADARDLDWMLHVNPALPEKGMLVVFNPLPVALRKTLRVDLHYTGLRGSAAVHGGDGRSDVLPVGPDHAVEIPVEVPAEGMAWYVFGEPVGRRGP